MEFRHFGYAFAGIEQISLGAAKAKGNGSVHFSPGKFFETRGNVKINIGNVKNLKIIRGILMSSQWFCDAFDTRSGAEETFQRGKLMLRALP